MDGCRGFVLRVWQHTFKVYRTTFAIKVSCYDHRNKFHKDGLLGEITIPLDEVRQWQARLVQKGAVLWPGEDRAPFIDPGGEPSADREGAVVSKLSFQAGRFSAARF